MVVIADSLNGLCKEDLLSGKNSDDSSGRTKNPDIAKILQETSEGLAHLSIQWPDYGNNYDMNVLEILKLVQVGRLWFIYKLRQDVLLLSKLFVDSFPLLIFRTFCWLIKSFVTGLKRKVWYRITKRALKK